MRLQNKIALLKGAAASIKGELLGFGGAAALRVEGHDARYRHLDVTSEQNWAQVVDAVMAAHGRLGILFDNAGVSFSAKVEDITVNIRDREFGVRANRFS